MSDLENELLGLAEEEPRRKRSKPKSEAYVDSSEDERNASEGEEEMDMDMDLESEEGEGDDVPARPAPVKRSSSSKVKKVAKGKAVKGRAVKSSGNGKGNGVDEARNPYPLEGKYVDEDDRDALEDLPEIERENILASRQEEMQKFKDQQQLQALYQQAGLSSSTSQKAQMQDEGDDEEGMDMDIDEDDEDEPSRKRRKHTSVTKETSRALNQLQKVRRKRHENAEKRAEKRAQASASGLLDDADSSDEDGEIDDQYSSYAGDRHRDRDRDGDYAPGRGRSLDRSPERDRRHRRGRSSEGDRQDEDAELDKMPASTMDLNSARVGRYEMVEGMYKAGFVEAMVGAYVRLMAPEPDVDGRPKYRIHRIHALQRRSHARYPVEYKDRTIYEDWIVLCTYGNGRREYRVADVSNGEFTNNEYGRFRQTSEADKVSIPKPSELKRIHEKLQELKARPMTNKEINAQVANRRAGAAPSSAIARPSSDPNAGLPPPSHANGAVTVNAQADARRAELEAMSEHDRRVAQINEIKTKRVRENMQKAHEGMLARRKLEEAMIRQKEAEARAKADDIQAVEEKAAEEAQKGDSQISEGGIRKGETPQQYVARTVELDLGDF